MSSCSYIALLINRERGAHNNEKEKRLSASEWLLKNRNDINEETFVYVYCLSYHSSTSNFCYSSC